MPSNSAAIDKNLYPVIIAGGKGTRFWPYSRESFPKQFLKLNRKHTLLQETMARTSELAPKKNLQIVTTADFKDLVTWQAAQIQFL